MQTVVILILIGLAVAGILFAVRARRSAKRSGWSDGQQAIIDTLTVRTWEPGFPTVFSASPLTDVMKAGIREAFRERFEKARSFGWTAWLDAAAYTIYVFPSVRDFNEDGVYCPSFQVFFDAHSGYDESIYDQVRGTPGGWTYAAEQVFTENGQPLRTFIIADNTDYPFTVAATSNGLDHILAFANDRDLYARTLDHSQGGGHPLW